MIWQVSYKNFAYLDIKKVFKKVPKMAMNKNGRLVQHLSSVENVHRTNSLAIDLSTIYGRDNMPTKLELFKFVHKQLNLKAEELVDCQNHPFMPLFFVKVKNETILTRTEAKLAAGVKVFGRNLVLYGWRCDIPLTTVRINGANPDTSKDKVVATMSKYGAVTACDRGKVEYFKDHFVSDGTWIIRMRPEQGKGLPSIIYFNDEAGHVDTWQIIFDGRVAICVKCGAEGHRGDQCRAVRPKPGKQGMTAPVGLGTWCDIVKKGLNEEWKGMANTGANFDKQKSLKVIEKKNTPVWPESLNTTWKTRAVSGAGDGDWQVPRATQISSMVGHRVPDVMLSVNTSNKYSPLSHMVDKQDEMREEVADNNMATKSDNKRKKNQQSKAAREVARKLDKHSTVNDFLKTKPANSDAMEIDSDENTDNNVGAGGGVKVLREKFGGERVRHVGGVPVTISSGKQTSSSLPVQTSPLHLPGDVDGHHDVRHVVSQH